jgi:hypothetical protein
MIVARLALALACFAIALVLTVMPGPAFVFWILGLALLGYGVGQILMSIHAVQEIVHRRLPFGHRLPRLRKGHVKAILRHRWVRALDHLVPHRKQRRAARARRRAERAAEVLRREGDPPAAAS